MVYRAGSDTFEELTMTGLAIGVLEDEIYGQRTIPIEPGDIIVLYTDGVTESLSSSQEMFGEERLKSIIWENRSLTATGIQKKIFDEVQNFSKSEPQFDDITLHDQGYTLIFLSLCTLKI